MQGAPCSRWRSSSLHFKYRSPAAASQAPPPGAGRGHSLRKKYLCWWLYGMYFFFCFPSCEGKQTHISPHRPVTHSPPRDLGFSLLRSRGLLRGPSACWRHGRLQQAQPYLQLLAREARAAGFAKRATAWTQLGGPHPHEAWAQRSLQVLSTPRAQPETPLSGFQAPPPPLPFSIWYSFDTRVSTDNNFYPYPGQDPLYIQPLTFSKSFGLFKCQHELYKIP